MSGIAEIFQLSVTCRRDQVTSMPMDYYAPGRGGGGGVGGCGSLDMKVFCGVFSSLFFSLKTSSEGYIIYRIVNCVSVI